MVKSVPRNQVAELCAALGIDEKRGKQTAALADRLFQQTSHVHGLTKTSRPLVQLAAMAYGRRTRGPKALAAALRRCVPKLSNEQQRILTDAVSVAGRIARRPSGRRRAKSPSRLPTNPAALIARRIAAMVCLAAAMNDGEGRGAGALLVADDGRTLELRLTGEGADGAAAVVGRMAGPWNAHMLRPVRAVRATAPGEAAAPRLTPGMTFSDAALRVLQQQFEQFLSRTYGLSYDKDMEFVHELRVALRRLRAGMRVFRKALNGELEPFRLELKHLARRLGAVRDQDVFLAFLHGYAEKVSAEHLPFVRHLIAAERQKRRRHYRAVMRTFTAPGFAQFRATYYPMLRPDGKAGRRFTPSGKHAGKVVEDRAPRVLRKQWKKLLAYQRPLRDYSPRDQHRLRIECKRLRYSAEFFADLYPDGLKGLITVLTKMQDLLGEVHDADVYGERVKEYVATRLKHGADECAATTAAMALVRHLRKRRAATLKKAASTWKGFAGPANAQQVTQLIAAPKRR